MLLRNVTAGTAGVTAAPPSSPGTPRRIFPSIAAATAPSSDGVLVTQYGATRQLTVLQFALSFFFGVVLHSQERKQTQEWCTS